MGQSFDLLPIAERIQQYRDMADAMLLKAKATVDPDLVVQFLSMATSWHALAQQLETGNLDPESFPPIPKADDTVQDPDQG